jgi:hypothetical protein
VIGTLQLAIADFAQRKLRATVRALVVQTLGLPLFITPKHQRQAQELHRKRLLRERMAIGHRVP